MSEQPRASTSTATQSTKTPKQPKQPKPPKPDGAAPTDGGKSAKDVKKEKRAAAVAARGGGVNPKEAAAAAAALPASASSSGPTGPHSASGPGSGPSTRPGNIRVGSHLPPSNPHTASPRRPGPFTSESSLHLSQPSQSLFFSHLPIVSPIQTDQAVRSGKIHPLVVRLGVLMSSGQLRGANARTHGLMLAFREVVRDYQSPENADLWKDLPGHLSPMIAWLESCRPKGVGGGNAIRWLKGEINRLGEEDEDRTEAEQKEHLITAITAYIRDRIELADEIIAQQAREKIKPGDVVVTYARSSVVEKTLIEAWHDMRQDDPNASFEVIVVDSKPLLEGRALLKSLSAQGIPSTYTLLTSLSPLLPRATLVLLGASALFANGSLLSRAGTALVASLAQEYRLPVVVAVETYKFGDVTRLDGLGTNEVTMGWREKEKEKEGGGTGGMSTNLTSLALSYDLTPADCITALCTEIGFIPPSSVPNVTGKASGVV